MAHWVTVKNKSGCYRQQMEYGYVDGVWTHYAIGRALPCNGGSTLTASGKPAAFVPKALSQQTTTLRPEGSSNGSRGMAMIYVIIGVAAIFYFLMK